MLIGFRIWSLGSGDVGKVWGSKNSLISPQAAIYRFLEAMFNYTGQMSSCDKP